MSHVAKIFVLAALLPSSVAAQPAAKSIEEIQQVLRQGQSVVVTDAKGASIKGTIADISDAALVLQVPRRLRGTRIAEPQALSWDTLQTIQRTDRRWNGALMGTWAGIAATMTWRAGCNNLFQSRESDHESIRSCRSTAAGPGALYLVPVGAALGLLIDDLIGNQRLALRRGGPGRVVVSPAMSPRGVGVVTSLEFKP